MLCTLSALSPLILLQLYEASTIIFDVLLRRDKEISDLPEVTQLIYNRDGI